MKRLIYLLSLVTLLIGNWAISPSITFAQSLPTATPSGETVVSPLSSVSSFDLMQGEDVVSFEQLGVTDTILRGPYDSTRVRFGLPANWQLSPGSAIQLVINYASTSARSLIAGAEARATGAIIDVTFNRRLITNIVLNWNGEQVVTIPIPADALESPRSDGRHELTLFLDAAVDCQYDDQTIVSIRANSLFNLPHTIIQPSTDLTLMPRPLFQEDIIFPNPIAIVTPDQPSESEAQAALTVAAGFGRMTYGQVAVSAVPVSLLSDEIRSSSHLIFVGKASALSQLQEVNLPAPPSNGSFNIPEASDEDGIVQLALSPWQEGKLVLVVSGNSDPAIIKAAQAVSSGSIQVGPSPNLAVVRDVRATVAITTVPETRSFTDLGYSVVTMSGIGVHTTEYRFFVPPGQVATSASSLNLIYNFSALLDTSQSGIVVTLNNQAIGSISFEQDGTQSTTSEINIPAYAVRSGINRLVIEADLSPLDICSNVALNNLWITIDPNSSLHIPLIPATPDVIQQIGLGDYPDLFASNPTMATTTFVLAQNNPTALDAAVKLAYDIGKNTRGDLIELGATYSNPVPDNLLQSHNLLIVGIPSELPLISELGDALPAPFDPNSNNAKESGFRVVYQLPEGTSMGYLELLQSPWDPAYSIYTVLGSTPEGLQWANTSLTDSTLRSQLGGDFAVIHDTQVLTSDSRLGAGTGGLIATAVPNVITTTPVTTTPVEPTPRPAWIIPAIIVAGALLIAVIIIAIVTSVRKGT
ncbi:MAG: cellulose biosynthesis cyclic di-GMP-binding regulatory protein BcsB [Chloroflexi bacterium]|nr:cellulose biosynthesis cyclic di-GMP-binding regulatory protein BcsB [Chloroflexota bacterium]